MGASFPLSIIVDFSGLRYITESASHIDYGYWQYERHRTVPVISAWLIIDSKHRRFSPFGFVPPIVAPRSMTGLQFDRNSLPAPRPSASSLHAVASIPTGSSERSSASIPWRSLAGMRILIVETALTTATMVIRVSDPTRTGAPGIDRRGVDRRSIPDTSVRKEDYSLTSGRVFSVRMDTLYPDSMRLGTPRPQSWDDLSRARLNDRPGLHPCLHWPASRGATVERPVCW